ncbi:MAG: pilus assembly protein PilP [Thioalkalispiraceae bacterium]|jgi:type IV pilus assembly protein PilP
MKQIKKHNRPFLLSTLQLGLLAVAITSITACSSEQHGDLQAYVDRVKAQKKGRVEPLPEVKPYATFAYSAHELREPFTSFALSDAEEQEETNGLRPDMNRKREALEQFPLDTLAFVGHLEKEGIRWGLISAPDKTVYRVQVGNHLGKNYGEILSINETAIKIKEIIPNGLGGWVEREASISLSE